MNVALKNSQYLFGQQLFTQSVECDKLPGEDPSVNEPLGHQHDFADQLKVWHHHGTRSVEEQTEGLIGLILIQHLFISQLIYHGQRESEAHLSINIWGKSNQFLCDYLLSQMGDY